MDKNIKTVLTNKPEVEAVKLTTEDLSLIPPRFFEGGKPVPMAMGWVWCWLQEDPDQPPIHFQRSFNGRLGGSGGYIQLGETPLSKHKILDHTKEMYPMGHPLLYVEVKGDPEGKTDDRVTYEMTAENPHVLYRFSSKYTHFVESNFVDITFEFFPYALVANRHGAIGCPYMQQLAIITGTYEGKKVTFLGGWDRMYGTKAKAFEGLENRLLASMAFSGIHSDGTREWGSVHFSKEKSIGFYCKDGEEPVISTDVKFDPTWEHLPYSDIGTMVITKATYSFGGKIINYHAKWGLRGHTEKYFQNPSPEPGFSQTSGDWYEGHKPYQFEKSFIYSECHNALEERI